MESLCLWVCMLLLLVQYPTGFSLLNNNSTMSHLCHEDESKLLLQLKQQLFPTYPQKYYRTKYWKGSRDCCLWDGVTCDDFTGHVISLDLSIDDDDFTYLKGELKSNSTLFHLTHLRNLNLAWNDFSGSTLPSEFGRLNALTHLNLFESMFGGQLPVEFYHLSNLLSLDLGDYTGHDKIRCVVKMLFENMTRLRVLKLAGQNLSDSELPMNMSSFLTCLDLDDTGLQGNLPATIFEKPNLKFLYLGGNEGLKGSLPKSLNWSNVHYIQALDLRWTSISGRLPDSIGLMSSLYFLSLDHCRFSGPIPESIGNITAITRMDLSYNDFSGSLPSTISYLTQLFVLDLSWNHLNGQIPDAFSGFQNFFLLDLSSNNLVGRIPSSLTNMSQLMHLDISSNALTGPFPSRAGLGLQLLDFMDLSNNSIQGMIPSWLPSLPSLSTLHLSSNRLTGQIGKFNSQYLRELDLSSNRLSIELQSFYNLSYLKTLQISHNTVIEHGDIVNATFPDLEVLEMLSCQIKKFPNFLRSNMSSLETLDLSNNSIHGPIPEWFTSNPFQSLSSLNLSYNFLTSVEDLPWQGLQYLDLHSNSLQGTFPSSICNISNLFVLILSHNKLRGTIPGWFASKELKVLGLNGNQLEGPLPPSLANCTWLEAIDLGNNTIQDTFPWWFHTLPLLKMLILKSNNFHGSITSPAFTNNSFTNLQILDLSYNSFTGLLPEKLFASLEAMKRYSPTEPDYDYGLYMVALDSFGDVEYVYSVTLSMKGADVDLTKVSKFFTIIDLSSNNFKGNIPDLLTNLTFLRLLNLSHNNIHGSIPPDIGHLTNLEQLDLSSNQLSGGIPQTLNNLTFLEVLGLSHNHLVGPIPVANQFLTFPNESYVGNSGLCGAPLTRSCANESGPPSPEEFEEDEDTDDGFMLGFTWKVVVMGYGCGIVLGFILGSVMLSMEKPRWLLRFVYVEAAIILSRRKKRRRMVQGMQ